MNTKKFEERKILITPIYVIEAKVKKYIIEIMGQDENENIDLKKVNTTIVSQLLDKIKIDYGVKIKDEDCYKCDLLSDLITLIKRQLNTQRMIKTPNPDNPNEIFIPPYSTTYSTQKNTIGNIIPFNDIFCKNCFYNAFYSSISYFQIEPFWFIGNTIYIYSFTDNYFHVEEINKTKGNLIKNYGLSIKKSVSASFIIDSIKKEINYQHPVISSVDTFYFPNRKDTYLSDHTPHYILLYGYDDEKQLFDIVEHDSFYSFKYKTTKLHYQDFFNSYYSYYKWFKEPNVYYVEQIKPCPRYSVNDIRLDYLSFYKRNAPTIYLGNNAINRFKKSFLLIVNNESVFWEKISSVIANLDICINRCFSNTYLYNILFPDSEILYNQLNIQKSWQKLAMILKMTKTRGKMSQDKLNNYASIIDQISMLENRKHCCLMEL